MTRHRARSLSRRHVRLPLVVTALGLAACSSNSPSPGPNAVHVGQSTFQSAPPNGAAARGADAAGAALGAATPSPTASVPAGDSAATSRTVQETDLYRVDGNTLYYLNGYRGLMVFDITHVDAPKLLSRYPIYGTPVQMFVKAGIAIVVVADWYGTLDSGAPFHGSIVVGLDATVPTSIKKLGDAKLGGWVQDTRIVGDVLYAVSVDYGWTYGWWGGPLVGVSGGAGVAAPSGVASTGGSNGPTLIVSSVSFANNVITALPAKTYPGYGGVFNVTQNAILLARPVVPSPSGAGTPSSAGASGGVSSSADAGYGGAVSADAASADAASADDVMSAEAASGDAMASAPAADAMPLSPEASDDAAVPVPVDAGPKTAVDGGSVSSGVTPGSPPGHTVLTYLDISDPAGTIVERQSLTVDGAIQTYGADNGRWSLDFADGKTAHVLGCANAYCGSGYVLATADFSDPNHPVLDSELSIGSPGWTPAALFAPGRMYLSPQGGYSSNAQTPVQIYDLTDPTKPALAGATQIAGSVWLLIAAPAAPGAGATPGQQLFALGQTDRTNSSQVSLAYIDVTNAAAPAVLGTSAFGDNWAWTPAASTFKAFTRGTTLDGSKGLVVLPFSGWSRSYDEYHNGVQLLEYTPTTLQTAGAAVTSGWVERGVFAKGRILSLSDLALSVVDYTDPANPKVTGQLTLARNVVASQPTGANVAEVSSDFWGNDVSQSDVRVLPASDAAEILDESAAPDVPVPGVDARVFTNGSLLYAVTSVPMPVPCPTGPSNGPAVPVSSPGKGGLPGTCTGWQQQVEVVDVSNGAARARGTVKLPVEANSYWGWGWGGFYYYDWFNGADIVQVGGDALAFRRWNPDYANGVYVGASDDLIVVDLSNPDAPALASTAITTDTRGWWGDMKVVNQTLYTTHYDSTAAATGGDAATTPTIRYYVDAIDLSDRAHPKIQKSINVPGVLVGGSSADPSLLYTVDYQWTGNGNSVNYFDVLKVVGDTAYLQSTTLLDGWVGNVIIRGNTAYASTQRYTSTADVPPVQLHQIDLTDPSHPVDAVASGAQGWGWLIDVQGDRMIVTSGWNDGQGLDLYKLTPGAAPVYDQFVRTRGWSLSAIARQGDTLFLSSGDWGVQAVPLTR